MASLIQVVLNSFGLNGVQPIKYDTSGAKPLTAYSGSFAEQTEIVGESQNSDGTDAQVTSWLGTPVWADVRLFPQGREDLILETVLCTISQRKNIVTTTIPGRKGTIKEYVSLGDYELNIKGAIVGKDRGVFPTQVVRDLLSVLIEDQAIKIVSDFLRIFDIYNIVVMDYSFPQQEGFQNMQLFEFNALSDNPVELVSEEDV